MKNTMTLLSYLWEHLWCVGIAFIWYNNLFFECLEGMDYKESKFIFWIIVFVTVACCIGITYEKNRTWTNAVINSLLPFGIYTFLALSSIFKAVTIITAVVIVGLTAMLTYMIFSRRIKSNLNRKKVIKKRIHNWTLGVRGITSCVMIVVVGIMGIKVLLNDNLLTTKTSMSIQMFEENQWRISNYIEKICDFEDERWNSLNISDRLDRLKIVANIECRYLGIDEINVGSKPLGENVLGSYKYATKTISIDTEHLRTGKGSEVLNTLLHEVRHAYQEAAVEALKNVPEENYKLYMYRDAVYFKEGLDQYGKDIPEGYVINELEMDSRKYARESVKEYFEEIDKCLVKKE